MVEKFNKDKNQIEIKLKDFGFATFSDENQDQGTPAMQMENINFYAPEIIQRQPLTEKVDIWAAGVICFYLFSGEYPFNGETREELEYEILNSEPNWEALSDNTSANARRFMERCLDKNPKKRDKADLLLRRSPFLGKAEIAKAKAEHKVKIAEAILKSHQLTLFQRAVCSFIANVLSNTDDIKNLRKIFRELDVDHDGSISLNEFKKGLPQMAPIVPGLNENSAAEIFNSIDQDSSGEITFSEFVTAGSSILVKPKNVEKAFRALDTKNDGVLDKDELQAAFSTEGHINADKEAIWNYFVEGID